MKQIYLQTTVNHMFEVDQKGTQRMFEEMGIEPEVKEMELKDGTPMRYYVFNIPNEEANL